MCLPPPPPSSQATVPLAGLRKGADHQILLFQSRWYRKVGGGGGGGGAECRDLRVANLTLDLH